MRKFVIGDIHGAYLAFEQCLKRAGFSNESDQLICLGDLSDGYPQTYEVLDRLAKIKKLILIKGNHDLWLLDWLKTNAADSSWFLQGGMATVQSLKSKPIHQKHMTCLESALLYYEDDNQLFVHAGILPKKKISKQDERIFLWDRDLAFEVIKRYQTGKHTKLSSYDKIYIGHTPLSKWGIYKPLDCCGVIFMDTGAGWGHPLSMMEIASGELIQSDPVRELYPGVTPRK